MRRISLLLAGGVLAGFALPARADAPPLSLKLAVPLSAFTQEHPPEIEMTVGGKAEWHGFIRVERYDLLSEKNHD